MGNTILEHAVEFLADAAILVKIHEVKRQGNVTRNFNLFEILDRARDEVKGHSKFLGVLLDPKGVHGLGDVFLAAFFDEINSHCGLNIVNDPEAVVITEKFAPAGGVGGRIDLYIETKTTIIVIENKIDAWDQNKQLERYADYVESNSNNKKLHIVYLTLDEREPSVDSRGRLNLHDINCVTYENFILDFLERCVKESANFHSVRESINQYIDLVRKITKGSFAMEDIKEIAEKIDSPQKMKAAGLIGEAIKVKRSGIETAFWSELESKLKNNLGAEELDFGIDCSQKYGEEVIKNGTGRYGIWFKIFEYGDLDYCFTIIKEGGMLYQGIRFLDTKTHDIVFRKDNQKYFDDTYKILHPCFEGGSSNDPGWVIYNAQKTVSQINIKSFSDEFVSLLDSNIRGELIDKYAKEIQEIVENSIRSLKNSSVY